MIVPGILVITSFLISVCMFIVSKSKDLLISSATVIVCAEGANWLYPLATVLFNVWGVGVYVYLLLCKEEGPSFLGFGMGTMLANFHMCGIMLVLRAVFNMFVRNASPTGPMCFRCLMFSLSGPCELLFLLCFIASWTRVVVSVILYPCILYVNGSVCLVCCVFDSIC